MNRNKRFMAGAAALVVAAVGFAGLQGLANAGTNTVTLAGSLFLNNTNVKTQATTNNTFTDTITLTNSPSSPSAGVSVFVTLSGLAGPSTGPVGVLANGQVIRALISLTGAQTATVELASYNSNSTGAAGTAACNYPALDQEAESPGQAWASYGQFIASGNGSATLALNQLMFDDQGQGLSGATLPTLCAGTANNADYYVSAVTTQTAGSALPGLTKTAPQNSSVVANTFTITGPNALIAQASGQNAGVQAVRTATTTGIPVSGSITLTAGTVWTPDTAAGAFVVAFCSTSGSSCDTPFPSVSNTLTTDNVGAISGGTITFTGGTAAQLTTGNRAIKLTQGSNVALVPVQVLGAPAVTLSPTSGGPGTAVTVTGSSFNPLQNVTVYGTALTGVPYTTTGDTQSVVAASSIGAFSTTFTVVTASTKNILSGQGVPGAPGAGNPSVVSAFTVNEDRCVAYTSNLTGGPGCNTKQNVNVSVLQGNLTQRVYVNSTAATGTGVATNSATTPVVGTSNVNTDATTVNLGTLTTPLAPVVITGTLNDITVSDNRGGTNGWSLTATGSGFTGVPAGTIAASNLTATPACAAATNSTAWDYTAVGKTAISGFDDTLNAGGVTAGSAAQAFGSTVNLCTKNTTPNVTTGSTGGVYNVTSSLALTVPAFQQAARYTAVVTVTLA
jgi:hypothetical protein